MSKPYRPYSGSEGEAFMVVFCEHCQHDNQDKPCPIIGRTMAYEINEAGYPVEWIQDDDGDNPHCTSFKARDGQ